MFPRVCDDQLPSRDPIDDDKRPEVIDAGKDYEAIPPADPSAGLIDRAAIKGKLHPWALSVSCGTKKHTQSGSVNGH